MAKPITYVGLDVHKDTIAVALAEAGLRGEVREHGKIPNTQTALKALLVGKTEGGMATELYSYRLCQTESHDPRTNSASASQEFWRVA